MSYKVYLKIMFNVFNWIRYYKLDRTEISEMLFDL